MQNEVRKWWRTRAPDAKVQLDAWFEEDGTISITDTRAIARQSHASLSGLHALIFALCDVSTTRAALARRLGADEDLQPVLDSLVSDGLLATDGSHYLTLAVFRNRSASRILTTFHGHDTSAQAAAAPTLLPMV
jgi:hypothetical protein